MACKQWNEEWVASLYDELDPDEQRRMSLHLDTCSACRRVIDELSDSRSLLREAAPTVPAAPRVVLLPERPMLRPLWAFAAGVACAAALFAAGTLVGLDRGNAARQSSEAIEARLTPEMLEEALQAQQAVFDERLEEYSTWVSDLANDMRQTRQQDPPETHSAVTRADLDQLQQQWQATHARDFGFLLEEVAATEVRAGTWADENRKAMQLLMLNNDPRIQQR